MIKLFEPVQYVICYGLKYNILYMVNIAAELLGSL